APNWKPQKYVELIERINTLGQIFVNAGPNNDELANIFKKIKNVFVYTSPNLRELITIISYLKLLVTSSTGTLHIASALNIPSVSLFCPLTACSPKLWGPLNENHYIALPPDGYCQHRCAVDPKKCTLDEISVESIASIVASHIQ
ncbi:MAG: glycosyltransferase family 9 protein, partial [Bacteroidia bacterium]